MSKTITAEGFLCGNRVQVPAYSDTWMRGDRCGEIVGFRRSVLNPGTWLAVVKMDVSRKRIAFVAADIRLV